MKKILLVNSVVSFHEENGSFLDRGDFRIFTASTGIEALEIHRQERVNLIISDLDLPEMGGAKFCTLIRAEDDLKNVAILLTCRNTAEDMERASQSGANAWISKPIVPDKILKSIGRLLFVSVRKDYRVLLKVQTQNEIDSTSFFCTSHNISTSGILFETDKLLNKGDRIICAFFLPGARRIVASGETVRTVTKATGNYQYGVQFIDLAAEIREEIERFVAGSAGTA
jgi:CheY-like chemotaxis protein